MATREGGRRLPLDAIVPAWGGIVLVVLALSLALATRHGSAVTPDSVQYLSAAQAFANGEGLTTSITELHTGAVREPFALWPPLYPILLGTGMRLGWTGAEAARWIALVAALLGTALTGLLTLRLAGLGAARAAVVLYGTLFSTTMTGSFVWSEPVFVVFVLASLLFAARGIVHHPRELESLFWAGLCAGLAMLTRYMGVITIVGIGLGLAWVSSHLPPRRVAWRLAAFLVPAAAPNLIWLARNRIITGGIFGPVRPHTAANMDGTLVETVLTLARDSFFPLDRLAGTTAQFGAVCGVLALVFFAIAFGFGARHLRFPDDEARSGLGIVLWAYVMIYLAGLAYFVTRIKLDPVNTRYLAPVYPVLVVLLAAGVRAFVFGERRRRSGHRVRLALTAGFAMLVAPLLVAAGVFAAGAGEERRDLTAPYWTSLLPDGDSAGHDPGLARIAELSGNRSLVISNRWELVGLTTGAPTKPLPEPGAAAYPDRLFAFPGALLAVHRPTRAYRVTADQLHGLAGGGVVFLEDAGDWSLFRISPVPRPKEGGS